MKGKGTVKGLPVFEDVESAYDALNRIGEIGKTIRFILYPGLNVRGAYQMVELTLIEKKQKQEDQGA